MAQDPSYESVFTVRQKITHSYPKCPCPFTRTRHWFLSWCRWLQCTPAHSMYLSSIRYHPTFYTLDFSSLETWKMDSFKVVKQMKWLPKSLYLNHKKYVMYRRCQHLRLCSLGGRWGMGMENCWNVSDCGSPKYSERNLSKCHVVHHKSQMAGINSGNRDEKLASKHLSHGMARRQREN